MFLYIQQTEQRRKETETRKTHAHLKIRSTHALFQKMV